MYLTHIHTSLAKDYFVLGNVFHPHINTLIYGINRMNSCQEQSALHGGSARSAAVPPPGIATGIPHRFWCPSPPHKAPVLG